MGDNTNNTENKGLNSPDGESGVIKPEEIKEEVSQAVEDAAGNSVQDPAAEGTPEEAVQDGVSPEETKDNLSAADEDRASSGVQETQNSSEVPAKEEDVTAEETDGDMVEETAKEETVSEAKEDDSFSSEEDYKVADEDEGYDGAHVADSDAAVEAEEGVSTAAQEAGEVADEHVSDTEQPEEPSLDAVQEKPAAASGAETDGKEASENSSFFKKDDISKTPPKKRSKKFLFWLIPAIAAGVAAAVIFGVGAQNKDKFWNDTYFGDMYVGGKTVDEVKAMLESPDKAISIKTREGNTERIELDDISYKSSYTADVQALKDSQSPYLWFAHGGGKNVYDVDISKSYDEDALKEKLANLDCVSGESIQDPVDAHLALAGDSFTIVEATEGNRIDTEKLDKTVIDGLNNGDFQIDLEEAGAYVTPAVYADDSGLKQSLEKIKSLESNVVTINLHDAEEKLDSKTFNSWLKSEGNELTVDDEALNGYLQGLADKYNTFGKEREFEATGLGKIKVGGGDWDTYGFKMDVESTAEAVKEAILAGKSDKVDVFWAVPAKQRNGKNGDIGNTYVEIDISRQHMWYYIDGKLFTDTDVRTGTESSSQWTPTTEGVYRILWKQTDKWFLQVGDPCHSDYWMPFNDRGEGIHDATWYSTYGGTLYKWAGSHGCINTPYSIAQKIFNNISEGTPVIVYRS